MNNYVPVTEKVIQTLPVPVRLQLRVLECIRSFLISSTQLDGALEDLGRGGRAPVPLVGCKGRNILEYLLRCERESEHTTGTEQLRGLQDAEVVVESVFNFMAHGVSVVLDECLSEHSRMATTIRTASF